MKDLILGDLPVDHPLRTSPLSAIGAETRWVHGKQWKTVEPHWKIATCCYNQLGGAWTDSSVWRATKPHDANVIVNIRSTVYTNYADVQNAIKAANNLAELTAVCERVDELFCKDVSPLMMRDDDWHRMTYDVTVKHDELAELG